MFWWLETQSNRVQRYGEEHRLVSLDAEAKVARLASGAEVAYEALVTTQPLDTTLRWLGQPKWADALSHRRAPPLPSGALSPFLCHADVRYVPRRPSHNNFMRASVLRHDAYGLPSGQPCSGG